MEDDFILTFLVQMTARVAQLHAERTTTQPQSNAGPRYNVKNEHTVYDEGFSRWMGWRGEDQQEREIRRISPEDLKAERMERSYRKVWEENRDLKAVLKFLHSEIGKLIV